MNSKELTQSNKKETNHDILGYADKDVENAYYAKIKMTNDVETVETLLQVDLSPVLVEMERILN